MKRNYLIVLGIVLLIIFGTVQQMNIQILNASIKEHNKFLLENWEIIQEAKEELKKVDKISKENDIKTEKELKNLEEEVRNEYDSLKIETKEIINNVKGFINYQEKYNLKIVDKIREANVARIRLTTTEVKVGRGGGTGVIVDKSDEYLWVFTARHVVDCSGQIQVKITDETGTTYRVDAERENVNVSDEVDLALIKIKRPDANFLVTPLATKFQTIGTKVFVMGHPYNLHYTYHTGVISNYIPRTFANKKGEYMMISAPVFPGNSGGAIVNKYNELVGIVVGVIYFEEGSMFSSRKVYNSNLTVSVQLKDIYKFLKSLED